MRFCKGKGLIRSGLSSGLIVPLAFTPFLALSVQTEYSAACQVAQSLCFNAFL